MNTTPINNSVNWGSNPIVDVHCHILPGLDDGPETTEEALAMARLASLDGTTDIIATPHLSRRLHHNELQRAKDTADCFQKKIHTMGIPLRIHVGFEVHIDVELLNNINMLKKFALGETKKYLMLDLPLYSVPLMTDELLYELKIAGMIPILAHPERNSVLRDTPRLVANWIDEGVIIQITAGSLTGKIGRSVRKAARYLVKHNMVHLIASDGHNTCSRPPGLYKAYEEIARLTSDGGVTPYISNAHAVLTGGTCILPRGGSGQNRIRRKSLSLFSSFLRRGFR